MCVRLWQAPRISRKFLENENLCCSATAATTTALGTAQFCFNCVSLVYGDDQSPNLSVPFQNSMIVKPFGILSTLNSLSTFRN